MVVYGCLLKTITQTLALKICDLLLNPNSKTVPIILNAWRLMNLNVHHLNVGVKKIITIRPAQPVV